MKAMVLEAAGRPLRLAELETPRPFPSMPYEILWGERVIRSVANLTRQDGEEFMELAGRVPFEISVEPHTFAEANTALQRLRQGDLTGAAVIVSHA